MGATSPADGWWGTPTPQVESCSGVGEKVGHGRRGDRMTTYIALFRGINVGGNNLLLMKDLVAALESLGCQDVATYIQSGNAVFQSKETDISLLSDRIKAAIKESHGFE